MAFKDYRYLRATREDKFESVKGADEVTRDQRREGESKNMRTIFEKVIMKFIAKLEFVVSKIKRDRWRRRLLIAWIVFPIVEILASLGLMRGPSFAEACLEILACCLLGIVHAAIVPQDWRASAMWPAALGTAISSIRIVNEMFVQSFEALVMIIPLVALGMLVLCFVFVRYLDSLLWRRIPAAILSMSLPILLRLVFMEPTQIIEPFLPRCHPTNNGPPVVLISVDALRADASPSMKTHQRLAKLGATWEKASSTSSWTWPAVVSLLSGVDAKTHGSGRKTEEGPLEFRAWDESLPMLPGEMRDWGYVTAAFVTNPIISLMSLSSIFDHWRLGNTLGMPLAFVGFPGTNSDGGDAADVVDAAIDWIDDAPEGGWFVWVHLYEPHLPYRHGARGFDHNLLRNARMGDWFIGKDKKTAIKEAYLAEVDYADQQLQRLLDVLENKGVLANGIVVFTSDHGEEFWEHGGFEHGHSHHVEVVDIPLILIGNGVKAERREDPASLMDIAPTIRYLLGMPNQKGIDLRRPIPDDRVLKTYGNAYYRNMASVRQLDKRVIIDGKELRAYDLSNDPLEKSPLADPDKVLRVINFDGLPAETGETKTKTQDDVNVTFKALRALGYVH